MSRPHRREEEGSPICCHDTVTRTMSFLWPPALPLLLLHDDEDDDDDVQMTTSMTNLLHHPRWRRTRDERE